MSDQAYERGTPHLKSAPATDSYRSGFDRIFGRNMPPPDEPAVDYTSMKSNDIRNACEDNAAKWAAAFVQRAKVNPRLPFDEGAMIGWFANAIETASVVRASRASTTLGYPSYRPGETAAERAKLVEGWVLRQLSTKALQALTLRFDAGTPERARVDVELEWRAESR